MLDAARDRFRACYGREPELVVRAPGRVNLIGEHTDYSEGLVLPCAIDRATSIAAAARRDGRVRVVSDAGDAPAEFSAAAPARRGDWVDYVQGPFFALAERGLAAPGLDLAVASDLPRESGLSSSAALGVAVACALREAGGFALSQRDLAQLAHRGETGFVGVQCGIMDQTASALGRRGHALRIDCRSFEVEPIPIGADRWRCCSCTRACAGSSPRALRRARGGVPRRPEQARAAGVAPGARALRDLAPADLPALARALEPLPLRRARHVITENARVDAFAAALRRGDLAACGSLLREAMASLRDDFAVSTPELDSPLRDRRRPAGLLRLAPHRRRLRRLHPPPRRPRRGVGGRRVPRRRLRVPLLPAARPHGS